MAASNAASLGESLTPFSADGSANRAESYDNWLMAAG